MANDLWSTPEYIFDWLNEEFHFDLDVCANELNHKCNWWFGYNKNLFIDGLKVIWMGGSAAHNNGIIVGQEFDKLICWMNPPYSDPYPWVKKAYEESQKGCTVVCLLPADTSTKWFHEYVLNKAEVRFVQGRIKFVDPETGKDTDNAPKFGSIIAIYGPNIEPKVIGVKRPKKPKIMPKNNQTGE